MRLLGLRICLPQDSLEASACISGMLVQDHPCLVAGGALSRQRNMPTLPLCSSVGSRGGEEATLARGAGRDEEAFQREVSKHQMACTPVPHANLHEEYADGTYHILRICHLG